MAVAQEVFKYWRHSHEEDTDRLSVYRPAEEFEFPVTLWRDGFEVRDSGVFVQDRPHPADAGVVKVEGTWWAEAHDRIRVAVPGQPRVINIDSVSGRELKIWREHLIPGEYLFEVSYVNHAWGYQHRGFFVDTTGALYRYEYPPDIPPFRGNPDDVYSGEDLAAKYAPGRNFDHRVALDELVEMHQLIEPASHGKLSDPVSTAFDAGQREWAAYLFDSDTATYRRVVLAGEGDFMYANDSQAAKRLTERLKNIGRARLAFPDPGRPPVEPEDLS